MIIVRLFGGLGNQLFQFACAKALAERHSTEVVLDVGENNQERERPYGLGAFALAQRFATPAEVRRSRGFGVSRLGREWYHLGHSLGLRFPGYLRERGYGFHAEVLTAPDGVYLKGQWMCERYFADQAAAVRRDLALRQLASGANAALLARLERQPGISLHVRRGDYLKPSNAEVYAEVPIGHYRRAAAHLLERTPGGFLCLFSDDPAWVRANLADLGAETVVVEGNGEAPAEDLRLMAACRHHIIANSTFSWWGAWLDPRPDSVVVAPPRWYVHPDFDDRDIVPERWARSV